MGYNYQIKTLFFAALLSLFCMTNLYAEEPFDVYAEMDSYTIEKGDTLWNISDRFLNDPFRWPKIWKLNPFIANPDLIFPGEVLNLRLEESPMPPAVEKVVEEEVEEVKEEETVKIEPEIKPEPLTVPLSSLGQRRGFISKEEIKGVGTILASREESILMGKGDDVYVSMVGEKDVHINKMFSIFDNLGKIVHPLSGDLMGYRIEIIGRIEIIEKEGTVYKAKIKDSFREILKGTRIMPYREPAREVIIKKGRASIDGVVLASLDDKVVIAENDIVFIDKGDKDGLERGNLLTIYKKGKDVVDSLNEEVVSLPLIDIGSLVIIDTRDNISTAMVIDSKKAIYKGDIVRLCERISDIRC